MTSVEAACPDGSVFDYYIVAQTFSVPGQVSGSAAGDGDGLADVVLATDNGVVVYRALPELGAPAP